MIHLLLSLAAAGLGSVCVAHPPDARSTTPAISIILFIIVLLSLRPLRSLRLNLIGNWVLALATFPHWQHYNAGFSEENVAHVDHRVEVALCLDDGGEVPDFSMRISGTISDFLRIRARF